MLRFTEGFRQEVGRGRAAVEGELRRRRRTQLARRWARVAGALFAWLAVGALLSWAVLSTVDQLQERCAEARTVDPESAWLVLLCG